MRSCHNSSVQKYVFIPISSSACFPTTSAHTSTKVWSQLCNFESKPFINYTNIGSFTKPNDKSHRGGQVHQPYTRTIRERMLGWISCSCNWAESWWNDGLAWEGRFDAVHDISYISFWPVVPSWMIMKQYETTDSYLIETYRNMPTEGLLQSGILSTSSLRDFSSRSESSLSSCFLLRSAPSL